MKNIILYAIIAILVVCVIGMGVIVYQNKISDMDVKIVALNNQVSTLQSQNLTLQSQSLALKSQIDQLTSELSKNRNLRTFSSVEELRSFLVNNAGYNFGLSGDGSGVAMSLMTSAKNQGYWMGLMPKQTEWRNYIDPYPYEDWQDWQSPSWRSYSNTPWILDGDNNDRYYVPYNNNRYVYNNYSSFGGVINVTVVGGNLLYTIENGIAIYAGTMSTGFSW